ncbi:MAG: hypothetical protein JO063_10390 [Pseudonocardiales bacterium]|nr:hypothetical protein [Pseudonocardiales bacterium]MBV9029885.1 hypothetical protein [Pseudonocardiales bacterium]MBW0010506.1 hypothetical protein [Pseudonocardiales bacterium]
MTEASAGSAPVGARRYSNVAPREDENDPQPDNEGEWLVAGRTSAGVLVVAPNSRYTFSFLRPAGTPLREVRVPESSSRFRSRDVFPRLRQPEDHLVAAAGALRYPGVGTGR